MPSTVDQASKEGAPAVSFPQFPVFDSLPAAHGLTNLEAFRLSLRHALTLLPALPPKDRQEISSERFRLD